MDKDLRNAILFLLSVILAIVVTLNLKEHIIPKVEQPKESDLW